MEDQCVITKEVTVAAGVFAPGHLGELTQIVPLEMVDAALAACGTRTVIDAVSGPVSCGEQDYTRRLRRSLHAGLLVLLDRNFEAAALPGQLAATRADLLAGVKANRKLPVLRRYRDGSCLSQIGAVRVRVTGTATKPPSRSTSSLPDLDTPRPNP